MRPVEAKLASALMSGFECGAHAANTGNEACFGPSAGIWDVVELLEARGYVHSPGEDHLIACGGIQRDTSDLDFAPLLAWEKLASEQRRRMNAGDRGERRVIQRALEERWWDGFHQRRVLPSRAFAALAP